MFQDDESVEDLAGITTYSEIIHLANSEQPIHIGKP
jgi:hypothetical protein